MLGHWTGWLKPASNANFILLLKLTLINNPVKRQLVFNGVLHGRRLSPPVPAPPTCPMLLFTRRIPQRFANTRDCFTSSPASYARRIPAVQEPGTEPGAVLPAAPQNMKPSVKLTDKITCQDCSGDTRDSREAA